MVFLGILDILYCLNKTFYLHFTYFIKNFIKNYAVIFVNIKHNSLHYALCTFFAKF